MQRFLFWAMLNIEKQNNEARDNGTGNQGTTRTSLMRCIAIGGFLREQ